ncbi:MAG: SDR family NAD(P)-dependent oxidoreductase [Rhodocyclaceae bacterium]|nr:SDR family NAD(P)-dependent oxidoreductase [Rhodocyclaceae bacterium]
MLNDQVLLITGASRGIGAASAICFAQAGAKVVAAARSRDALEDVAARIGALHGTCLPIPADVTDEASVRHLVAHALARFGRIDLLINNAGVGVCGPTERTTLDDWNVVIGTNLKGAFLCAREIIPVMVRQGGGHIINVASQAGRFGFPRLALYCASKYGLIGMSESLGRELAASNIRVSYLCPGWVDTAFLEIFQDDIVRKAIKASPHAIAREILDLATKPRIASRPTFVGKVARLLKRRLQGAATQCETYSSF